MSKILHEEHKVQKITVLILLISVICYIGGQEGHFKETDILSHQSTLLSLSHTHTMYICMQSTHLFGQFSCWS